MPGTALRASGNGAMDGSIAINTACSRRRWSVVKALGKEGSVSKSARKSLARSSEVSVLTSKLCAMTSWGVLNLQKATGSER